jgi:hypothetical protein
LRFRNCGSVGGLLAGGELFGAGAAAATRARADRSLALRIPRSGVRLDLRPGFFLPFQPFMN